jgi:hypothetical protein
LSASKVSEFAPKASLNNKWPLLFT